METSSKDISFIIVNYNGVQFLNECFDTLNKLDYPKEKIELILVDNGSSDDSISVLEKKYPYVKIIKNSTNEGFAKPNNDAAKIAKGKYLALINNDMRIDKNWINDMLRSLKNCNDESYVCVGSKILNWDGTKLDFAGGSITFEGEGYQYDYGMDITEANKIHSNDKDILFACGGSMLIRRDVFLEVGGFDEDYFAYYEDVDLGWRLWILGYKVRFCSKAVCYHKHNGTSKKFDAAKKKALFLRNRLYTIYKNYSDNNKDIVDCTLFLMLQRMQMDLGIKSEDFNIGSRTKVESIGSEGEDFSTLVAINEFSSNISKFNKKRKIIQSNRKASDEQLNHLIPDPFKRAPYKYLCNYDYTSIFRKFVNNFKLEEKLDKKLNKKILLISNDKIGAKMAGPGIRYIEFAKQLCKNNEVILAIPNEIDLQEQYSNIKFVEFNIFNTKDLINAAMECDIIILQGFILQNIPLLKDICKNKVLVVDIYDPFVIEFMESNRCKSMDYRLDSHNSNLKVQLEQLKLGDYFICSNEKQKDLWIGMLSALNKINPVEYDLSLDLKNLIGIVPFGISTEEPKFTKDLIREKIPNLKEDDKVLIWGGGIWNWFDPITLIKAVHEISKTRDDVKLFFMGIKHPNPDVPEMETCVNAIKTAKKLGVKDKCVFFNMDWVEYDDRQNFLLQSHIGVSCHLNSLETRYSFRTRILDYLWARLPIIATEGDFFAETITEKQLGIVVKYGDVADLSNAILRLLDNKEFYDKCVENIDKEREKYKWDIVVEPLADFCESPIKKKVASLDGFDDEIIDIEQIEQEDTVGQLLKGRRVGQKFACRYPNLSIVEVKVGTYLRNNNHTLKFYLYEAINNRLIVEEEIEAGKLLDNAWCSVSFKPIINSQGRKFYFYFEGMTTKSNNCITLWKTDEAIADGSIIEDDSEISGSLVFRTKCVYSKKPLSEKDGILLDNQDDLRVYDFSNSEMKYEDESNPNQLLTNSLRVINVLSKKIDSIEKSNSELNMKYNKIDSWKNKVDRKITFAYLFKKLFRR